jgi:hypothetical protein
LPFAASLNASDLAFALATVVGLYGTSQLALGSYMLFLEYRAGHPAPAFDFAWQQTMQTTPQPVAAVTPDCGSCAACPAEELCRDASLHGQIASVMAGREPLIVRASQISKVLETAHA